MPVPHDAALAVWNRFEQYSASQTSAKGPFRIQCGLRYSNQGEGNRATAVLWSNGDLPLRLDVLAMGTLIARVRQDSGELLIHAPRDGKAWVHTGKEQAFLAFGMPLPLALSDIAYLLQGRYGEVFGPMNWDNPVKSGPNTQFTLTRGTLPGSVVLSPEGLLLSWQEAPGGWVLDIEYEGTPPLPSRLDIKHPEGRHAVLTVVEREHPAMFTAERLALALPEGTTMAGLRQAMR